MISIVMEESLRNNSKVARDLEGCGYIRLSAG